MQKNYKNLRNNMKTIQFATNTAGRDFVVGDLHGCIDLFNAALAHINFDKTKDRMFSVGDLGDRGPNSPACMDLMYANWFHAVRSNHGDLMSGYYEGNPMCLFNWSRNGGDWAEGVDEQTMLNYAKRDKKLPYALTVNLIDGRKFHVIHAEFSTAVPLTDSMLASKDINFISKVEKASFTDSGDGPLITWGRVIFRQFFNNNVAAIGGHIFPKAHLEFFNTELSHIYSGHTVMKQPTRYLGQTNIDTGAVFSANEDSFGLTITEPLTDRFWKTNNNGTVETTVIDV